MAGKVKKKDPGLRFRSRSEHTLDSKGRLNIPSRFREVLRDAYSDVLVVTNWQKSLKAYPVSEWKKVEDTLHAIYRNYHVKELAIQRRAEERKTKPLLKA